MASYQLPHHLDTWPSLSEILIKAPSTFSELASVFKSIYKLCQDNVMDHFLQSELPGLKLAIERAQALQADIDVYHELLPFVWELAKRTDLVKQPLPIALAHSGSSTSLTREQIGYILAHQFLGSLTPYSKQTGDDKLVIGILRCHALSAAHNSLGGERLTALLLYFDELRKAEPDTLKELVLFERHHWEKLASISDLSTDTSCWQTCKLPLKPLPVILSRMEDAPGHTAIVDFANRDLMIGETIPSATQEEILFTCHPELYASLLMMPRMAPDEAVIMKDAAMVLDYTGYGATFKLMGARSLGSAPRALVIAIDARPNIGMEQYMRVHALRDVVKAATGFAAAKAHAADGVLHVATGLWGCGAFGNNPVSKYLQQCIVASALGIDASFCVHANAQCLEELSELADLIATASWSVADAVPYLYADDQALTRSSFNARLRAALRGQPLPRANPSPKHVAIMELYHQALRLEEEGDTAAAMALHRKASRIDAEIYNQFASGADL
eukprot:TRINITY_DN12328_c1_g1_i3.p1 TRINITY_DN12328_c1_g1~~TRINITY_DN12328_c1_g1_i3.p1  ORF type:complete len:502 (+),score=100.62 TRINITY_DN12328_c1_g1_i3:685-2190(+)